MAWTIYCHQHIESGRRYVGLTKKTMLQRWNQHVYTASRESKGWSHFANAIRKYGKEAFSHEVLEICSGLDVANLAEECWIELLDTRNPEKGFNLARGGAHAPHPMKNPWDRPEYREKSVQAAKDRWGRPEYREKCIEASRTKALDPEFRSLLSQRTLDTLNDPEVLARRSAASRNVRANPEFRELLSKASIQALSDPIVRARLSEAAKRPRSESHKAATSKALTGRTLSELHRENMRRASAAKWKDPVYRAKVVEGTKAAWRPEYKKSGYKLSQETKTRISISMREARVRRALVRDVLNY